MNPFGVKLLLKKPLKFSLIADTRAARLLHNRAPDIRLLFGSHINASQLSEAVLDSASLVKPPRKLSSSPPHPRSPTSQICSPVPPPGSPPPLGRSPSPPPRSPSPTPDRNSRRFRSRSSGRSLRPKVVLAWRWRSEGSENGGRGGIHSQVLHQWRTAPG